MIDWDVIVEAINNAASSRFEFSQATPLSGGCINQTFRISSRDKHHLFIKLNTADMHTMFDAESRGLSELAETQTIRVPQPIAHGIAGGHSFLALEYFNLIAHGDATLFGQQLAGLHRSGAQKFGFEFANTIGATPQHNDWQADWITFWREQRLGFQLALAAHNNYGGTLQSRGQQLMERLPEFFTDYQPVASLLHGDLWSGNHAYTTDGSPLVFDPAPYYGDREADLAMTELFGGFSNAFYAAYHAAWPLEAGYATRKVLYNLYHTLNHANLFGGSYARQAEGMMEWLLHQLD